MLFSSQIKTFGLDISDQALRVAQINSGPHGLELSSCHQINLPSGILSHGEIKNEVELIKYIKKVIGECQPKIKSEYVVACLPEVKTFIKLIKITVPAGKKTSEKEIEEVIKHDLPNHIPLPLENIYFDWQIISRQKNNLEILLGIAPQVTVNELSELLKKSGLLPISLEIEGEAIVRAILPRKNKNFLKKPNFLKKINCQQIFKKIINQSRTETAEKQPIIRSNARDEIKCPEKIITPTVYLIIDCGASRTGLIAFADDTIQFTTSLKTSSNDLTELISQKLGLEKEKAEKIKTIYGLKIKGGKAQVRKILLPTIDGLAQEIIKAKEFYQNNFPDHHRFYEIILTGGGANLIGLDLELSARLGMKVGMGNPLINLSVNKKTELAAKEVQSYTTAIGLALRSHLVNDY